MDKSWINADDPWLVKAMHASTELAKADLAVTRAVAQAMDEYLRAARSTLLGETVIAAENIPDLYGSWPPDSLWVQLVREHVLPVIEATFVKAFTAALEGVTAAVDIWRSAFMTEVQDRLSAAKWPKEAFEKVRSVITAGIEAGRSINELTNQLHEILSIGGTVNGEPVWESDARRIARTESLAAYNGGTYNGALAWQQETGQTRFKQWLSTSDGRTRETHREAHDQVQPFTGRFRVGLASLLFPGDPSGPADEIINCRCALLILSADEAAAGGLIAASTEVEMTESKPHWRGTLITLETKSGDGRIYERPEEVRARDFRPIRYLPADWGAHDGAVNVGHIDRVWLEGNNLIGEGRFDLQDPWTAVTIRKMREGFAGGISVDLDDLTFASRMYRGDEHVKTEEDFDDWEDLEEVLYISDWRLAGATILDIPAFPGAFIELIEENLPSEKVLIASAIGAPGLPLASRERQWDGDAAARRVADWAKGDAEEISPEKYGRAFFYRDAESDPTNVTAYKLGFADIIDGTLTAIPRGIFAVAGALEGARSELQIPDSDKETIKGKVSAYYRAMADKFDDPGITPPWDNGDSSASDSQDSALVAAGPVPNLAPKKWFENPQLTELTPLTVEEPNTAGFRRVFGHVAAKGICHVGIKAARGQCVTVPDSPSGYRMFNRIPYETDGGIVQAGRLTAGYGELANACGCCPGADDHACLRYTFNQALAHHDKMTVLANIVVGEDEHGIWCAGVAASELDGKDLSILSRRKVSGDWRSNDLVEVLVLSSEEPGFPVARQKIRAGSAYSLVAAGAVIPHDSPCVTCNDGEKETAPVQSLEDKVRELVGGQLIRIKRAENADNVVRKIRAESAAMAMREVENVRV